MTGQGPERRDDELLRGNGVGLEIAGRVIRGVRLGVSRPGEPVSAAEVAIATDGEIATLDALVRMWAELGEPNVPTRLACFPPGSSLRRRDVTGFTGPELSAIRRELDTTRSISSTVVVDLGARRWLLEIDWDESIIRLLEGLTERAGFVDVTVDPSPLALARALPTTANVVRRDAAIGSSFEYVANEGVPLAAAATEPIGSQPPALTTATRSIPDGWFDEVIDTAGIHRELARVGDGATATDPSVVIGGDVVADRPGADVNSPIRQCVAIGAAATAAGLTGRVHPLDVAAPPAGGDVDRRPWAIERVSELPALDRPTIGGGKRLLSRLLPRRR